MYSFVSMNQFMSFNKAVVHDCSFLLFSSIPLNKYTTICLSIHLLMDIWAFPLFDDYKQCYEHICTGLRGNMSFFLMSEYLAVKLLSCMAKCVFNFIRNCQTDFQRSYSILHFLKQCTAFPNTLCPHQNWVLSVFLIGYVRYHTYHPFIWVYNYSISLLF